ncbi:hypothetical protein XVE_3763 [Xanthomonas vesicatoria ATCC 35937]|uniref:Uncharacterized protein n=1 Tax=Xanthomonas vesicatoria ATCC 35937 TaxID=925775 RepID=F0BHM1_9XANT|nr:hypothetical protein XVE_3763 [Xanthomonas vesicatoria ATCC 35937]
MLSDVSGYLLGALDDLGSGARLDGTIGNWPASGAQPGANSSLLLRQRGLIVAMTTRRKI